MMRVHFQPAQAFATVALSAFSLLLGAGCASKALDEPAAQGEPEPSGGTDGAAAGPDYRQQDYPAGPYGVGVGSTLEDFAFLGWRDPVASNYDIERMETVRLSEFYNPDGRSEV